LINKNIFITGGGSGIGEALTKSLIKNNNLIVTFFKSKKKILDFKKKYPKNIEGLKVNLNNQDEIVNNAKYIKKKFKKINIIIFNALVPTKRKMFMKTSINEIEKNFKRNFLSNVIFTKELLNTIIKQKQKCQIIHISSNVSKYGGWGLSSYAPIKSAFDNFLSGIEREFSSKIQCISVKLGPVKTKGYLFTNGYTNKKFLSLEEASNKIISKIK
jgi:NADP-dependent 3-hydroxy acid dehydrogenase YdfG